MILLLKITKRNGGRRIARKLRDWYPGAIYHIMHRGVRRKPIFEDEMDHQVLLQIIKTSLSKYNCWLHAYCLMTNHVHLLLETGDIEIGKFMKYMSECYAIYYNHKYGYRGHVFESRYKSCLVKEDAYFLQTSRYIHLNPVKAQMTDYPEDYLWSSYRTMIGIEDDGITEKKKTLAYFPKNSIYQYRGKISGPIMDRIDIQKEVHPVDFFAIADQKSGASSEELRTKVEKARKIQQERYAQEKGINCNAQMTTELIQRYCVLDKDSLKLLRETSEKYGYSARVIHKLLRLARTSADLDGEEKIRQKDIEKVLTCRELDKSNSKMVVVK